MMSDRSVQFQSIHIEKVLGILKGEGFTLSELSPGVNLIYGPNGSGKSTTAVAIQELLWSGRTGLNRPSLRGQFIDGTTGWSVDIDAGYVESQRAGQPGMVPEFGPPERRRRYHLALHELLSDDNADFAKTVADASQGGYDLEKAAEDLHFKDRPTSPRKQIAALKDISRKIEEARHVQSQLKQNADRLPDLRDQRDEVLKADRKVALLEKVLGFFEAGERYQQIQAELDTLPENMDLLRGTERDDLDQLSARRVLLQAELETEARKNEEAEQDLKALNLPDEGVDQGVIAPLKSLQRKLVKVESDLYLNQQIWVKADAIAHKSRTKLSTHITNDQLEQIDKVEVGELSQFAREVIKVQAQQAVLQKEHSRLERMDYPEVEDLDGARIREGITFLGQWLASCCSESRPATNERWNNIVAGVLFTAMGLSLAFIHHWGWTTVAMISMGFVITDWWRCRQPVGRETADARDVHRQSYEATGLPGPDSWTATDVSSSVRELIALSEKRNHEDERLRRLEGLQGEIITFEQHKQILDRLREDIAARFGFEIKLSDDWLPLLVDIISTWQIQSTEAAAAKQVLVELENEQIALLQEINAALQPYNYDPVDLADTAAQYNDDLDDRRIRHQAATVTLVDTNERIANSIEPGLKDIDTQQREIFAKLKLNPADESVLDDQLKVRPGYLALRDDLSKYETLRDDRQKALAGHDELLDLGVEEVEDQIDRFKASAEMLAQLTEDIVKIESDISSLKAGYELSDALSEKSAAEYELALARDESSGSVVGALLMNWVRKVAVQRSRPPVFKRANELMVRFSRGTLSLDLDDQASPPVFKVRRSAGSIGSVDTLSMGERVQLLIAVRMAFLEYEEQTRLPLILDETLGTSDDSRTGVIIDNIIDIAKDGRQVFYFTAQNDEVGKWNARLKDRHVPHKVIDLAHGVMVKSCV